MSQRQNSGFLIGMIIVFVTGVLLCAMFIVHRVHQIEEQMRDMDARLCVIVRNAEHQQRDVETIGFGVIKAESRISEIDDLFKIGGQHGRNAVSRSR